MGRHAAQAAISKKQPLPPLREALRAAARPNMSQELIESLKSLKVVFSLHFIMFILYYSYFVLYYIAFLLFYSKEVCCSGCYCRISFSIAAGREEKEGISSISVVSYSYDCSSAITMLFSMFCVFRIIHLYPAFVVKVFKNAHKVGFCAALDLHRAKRVKAP